MYCSTKGPKQSSDIHSDNPISQVSLPSPMLEQWQTPRSQFSAAFSTLLCLRQWQSCVCSSMAACRKIPLDKAYSVGYTFIQSSGRTDSALGLQLPSHTHTHTYCAWWGSRSAVHCSSTVPCHCTCPLTSETKNCIEHHNSLIWFDIGAVLWIHRLMYSSSVNAYVDAKKRLMYIDSFSSESIWTILEAR